MFASLLAAQAWADEALYPTTETMSLNGYHIMTPQTFCRDGIPYMGRFYAWLGTHDQFKINRVKAHLITSQKFIRNVMQMADTKALNARGREAFLQYFYDRIQNDVTKIIGSDTTSRFLLETFPHAWGPCAQQASAPRLMAGKGA